MKNFIKSQAVYVHCFLVSLLGRCLSHLRVALPSPLTGTQKRIRMTVCGRTNDTIGHVRFSDAALKLGVTFLHFRTVIVLAALFHEIGRFGQFVEQHLSHRFLGESVSFPNYVRHEFVGFFSIFKCNLQCRRSKKQSTGRFCFYMIAVWQIYRRSSNAVPHMSHRFMKKLTAIVTLSKFGNIPRG